MHTHVPAGERGKPRSEPMRSWTYWISAAASTLLFLNFMATIQMVPGIAAFTKVWMLSVAGVAVAISLAVGTWRPNSTEAPVTIWPLGSMVCVVLLLELAVCVVGVVLLAAKGHR